jgi:hypothetical protein
VQQQQQQQYVQHYLIVQQPPLLLLLLLLLLHLAIVQGVSGLPSQQQHGLPNPTLHQDRGVYLLAPAEVTSPAG